MAGVEFRVGDVLKVETPNGLLDTEIRNMHSDTLWLSSLAIKDMHAGQSVVFWLMKPDATYKYKGELRSADMGEETLVMGIVCTSKPERHQRRAEYRTYCKMPVKVKSEATGIVYECRAIDISTTGVGLIDSKLSKKEIENQEAVKGKESYSRFKDGERILCSFTLGGVPFNIKAIVRRCYVVGDGKQYRIGTQFIDIDYKEARSLQKIIFQMQVKQR